MSDAEPFVYTILVQGIIKNAVCKFILNWDPCGSGGDVI